MSHATKGSVGSAPNPLHISWHDSAWNANQINRDNVLDYFAELTNPFYDRTCNNQVIKMQRISPEHLVNMQGLEYTVCYAQEPLFVIRKQYRSSPTQVSVLSNYYIIGGVVYQAPDLASVINSRILSATHGLRLAFNEALSYSRYHPAKGYWWEFPGGEISDSSAQKSTKTEPASNKAKSTLFQRTRVDVLLGDLVRRFPWQNEQRDQEAHNLPQANKDQTDVKPVVKHSSQQNSEGQPSLKRIKTEPALHTM